MADTDNDVADMHLENNTQNPQLSNLQKGQTFNALQYLNEREGINHYHIRLSWYVRSFGTFNRFGARVPVPTKINIDLLQQLLQGYEDMEVVEWLKFGWPTGRPLNCPETKSLLINHKGANLFPQHIDNYFKTEISQGATIGPLVGVPWTERVAINPLNSRSKRGSSDNRRIILDLSFPRPGSVNDMIPKDTYLGNPYKLTYPTVDTMAQRVHELGPTCLIYRVDESRSFRQIPLDPFDYGLIGMYWKGLFFFDVNSPQGLRTGAMFCQRTTNAVRYIMNQMGYFLMNYLDDLHGCELPDRAWKSFEALLRVMRDIRRDIAHNKTTTPCQVVEVLGIWFDIVMQIIAVGPDRLSELMQLLEKWRFQTHATKKDMQRLIGKLQFVAKCIRPGRLFISRLLRWMTSLRDNEFRAIDRETRLDIKFWYDFLPRFNGVSILWHLEVETPDEELASDSCLTGCGAHSKSQFFHSTFPQFVLQETTNIAQRELLTICATIKTFAHTITGKKITFLCDNLASVQCVNSGRSKDPFMQRVLREIVFVSAINNCWIRTKFIGTKSNRKADILSRWHLNPKQSAQHFAEVIDTEMTEIKIQPEIFELNALW